MSNKTCNNCLYQNMCDCTERCDYYYPLYGEENIAIREYNEALKERVEDYQEIVDEMEN